MTRAYTWTNEDGLKVPFGTSDGVQSNGGSVHTVGMNKELRLDLDASNLPVVGSAVSTDNVGIPAGAGIISASLRTTETFSGAITIGTMGTDGVVEDADGLLTTVTPASGSFIAGTGAQIGTAADEDLYIAVAGTVTTGKAQLVVEYRI